MRRGSVDCFFSLGRIGEVDAAEFQQVGGSRDLCGRMVDARNTGAAGQRFVDHAPAKRTQRTRHDNDFSIHEGLRTPRETVDCSLAPRAFDLQCG